MNDSCLLLDLNLGGGGIGLPYFSFTCYWYMVDGEERALEFATVEDVSADAAYVIKQVTICIAW